MVREGTKSGKRAKKTYHNITDRLAGGWISSAVDVARTAKSRYLPSQRRLRRLPDELHHTNVPSFNIDVRFLKSGDLRPSRVRFPFRPTRKVTQHPNISPLERIRFGVFHCVRRTQKQRIYRRGRQRRLIGVIGSLESGSRTFGSSIEGRACWGRADSRQNSPGEMANHGRR